MKLRYTLLYSLLLLAAYTGYAQAPIEFIPNKGQWAPWFQYKAVSPGGEVFMENDGMRYLLCDAANVQRIDSFHIGLLKENPTMKFHVYKMTFEGANKSPRITGAKQQSHYYNYYLGNDPEKWKGDVHPYLAMDYTDLYNGIDMHVSSDAGSLIYEFFVHPGADANQVKLGFEGQEQMFVKNGNLFINTSVGQMQELKPVAFQYINGEKKIVACSYHLRNNKLTFDLPDDYDHTQTLVIDPTVVFCSFTGSTADNWGFTATYDNAGNFYLGGLVNALSVSAGGAGGAYPVSPGAYQSVFGGGQSLGGGNISYAADLGIMKLSADGASRLYATYIGGSANERPHSMIVDPSGNLIIAGKTRSVNFPVTAGAFQSANAGAWDIFVTKLNAAGTALLASTYIGGSADDGNNFDSTESGYGHLKYNYGDDARSEVQVDNLGNIYVASCSGSSNFPTASPITTYGGGFQDGVVFKMNASLTSLLWSTFIGGTGDDAGYVLSFNNSQTSVYVAGGTNSTNFPVGTGGWHTAYGGDSADGFILKFKNSAPYNVQKGTFVGTSNFDQVYGLQVDATGNVYCMGQSMGGTFPVTSGVYSNPSSTQFIMKMDSNLTTDIISTVFGSGDPLHTNISPVAFLIDTCENVYISGWGGNIMGVASLAHTGTTSGMAVTSDAAQSTTDGFDFYFMVLGSGMTSLRYATFYGRSSAINGYGEHVDGGTSRFDKHGIIYQGICANCGGPSSPPFPTTAGAWSTLVASSNCNEAGLKIAFNIGPVEASITAGPSTSGCAPLTVNFTNSSNNALSYVWNFGDGSPIVTSYAPSHVFTAGGTYTVTLSAANSTACFQTDDTAYIVIHVDTNKITPAFEYTITDSCGPYIATFTNASTSNISTPASTYQWWFGDGGNFSGDNPGSHNYPAEGTYTVTLVMNNTAACKTPDTVIKVLHINAMRVGAAFVMPDSICLGTSFSPVVTGSNVATYNWTYGNGQGGSSANPSIHFTAPGNYTVTLIVQNPGSCNGADTFTRSIRVLPTPTANFSFTPIAAVANEPTKFNNLSINAIRYLWDFGDDNNSTEINPTHQYNKTGLYTACLTAYNDYNCPSTLCKEVPAEVVPIIGIPTGFSPNGDGENDILYVRGAAIKTMDLKIYNRWGQLIFETTSQDKGWDGTFNGQKQPIEAYGYVLTVSFIDGSAKTLKGNITLLR